MKYCPACGTEYDEEVIQFCTKDGTPLVENDEPRFTALPSESDEDADTFVRSREQPAGDTQTERGERIVIPATPDAQPREQQVRTRPAQTYYAPPPQQNTTKVIALTILGTVAAIGFGALLFWALSRGNQTTNLNVNTNPPNMNVNTNGFDSNFNFNANIPLPPANISTIPNIDANVKTPTPSPTPKPSPSVSPTASVVPTVTPERTPRPSPSGTPRVSPTPTPRTGPRPPGNLIQQ